jgi:hypothetical protein
MLRETFSLKRIALAILIAAGIYGIALGVGSLLYATGNMPTGATHNDCSGYRKEIAEEQGIAEEDVPQSEIKARTEACLATHEQTDEEAFKSEYLFWSIWPGVICAAIFLIWPVWTRILLNQEAYDEREGREGRHHASNHA